MTDNLNESNPANPEAKIDNVNASNTSHNSAWQLNAVTTALGDLSLTVSDSLSVGRGSDNDVVLGSKAVSRNHAVLSVLNAELYVKDLDSSNGTFVNDERIAGNQSFLLKAEDKLGFASFDFQVMAPVDNQSEMPATDPVADELEDIVGTVQENLEANVSPVTETAIAIEPSVPAATKETGVDSPIIDSEIAPVESTPQPVVKETIIGEVLSASADEEAMSAAPVEEEVVPPLAAADTATLPVTATEETNLANDKVQEPVDAEPLVAEPTVANPAIETPLVAEPTVETPIAAELVTEEPVAKAPVVEEPLTNDKLIAEKSTAQQSTTSPEQDKTTTTALQEEADPDVLRAKQAATSQFSGTANLGQGRDLGTTGNNAMDQAINNPANNAQGEKKASGGWFIWVFIAILIIGIALWLFNMGGA